MSYKELTEKDLDVKEKKVFGRIIDMWSLGSPEDPYDHATESEVVKYSKKDELSEEDIMKVLKDLEAHRLIHRAEENCKIVIKYKVEAAHIVKELQKTAYCHSKEKFKPPHH